MSKNPNSNSNKNIKNHKHINSNSFNANNDNNKNNNQLENNYMNNNSLNNMSMNQKTQNNTYDNTQLSINENQNNNVSLFQKVECVGKVPSSRFGHTVTSISPVKVILFGGAIGDTRTFQFTSDTYILNLMTKIWMKLESKILNLKQFNFSKGRYYSDTESSTCSM